VVTGAAAAQEASVAQEPPPVTLPLVGGEPAAPARAERPGGEAVARPGPPVRNSGGLPTAAVPLSTGGRGDAFIVASPTGGAWLRFSGSVQVDGRAFLKDGARPATSQTGGTATGLLVRRARPAISGAFGKYASFRLMTDFAGGQSQLFDAYIDLGPDAVRVMVGKFKAPFGLERLQGATGMPLIERGLPTELAPNRDVGVQLHGEPLGGIVRYAVGVFNGAPDGGSAEVDIDDHKDVAGHLFFQPFHRAGVGALEHLGLGAAATRGRRNASSRVTMLPAYRAPSQAAFFRYRDDAARSATVVADGKHQRLAAHGFWFWGRGGAVGEYVVSTQAVSLNAAAATLTQRAWQATLELALTDDRPSFGGLTPARPFAPGDGRWGAVLVAARYGQLRIDGDAFPTFADPGSNPQRARSLEAGLTWVLDAHAKLEVDYAATTYALREGARADAPRSERLGLARLQASF
jgi:phosphate-selective porin OprO and OprP